MGVIGGFIFLRMDGEQIQPMTPQVMEFDRPDVDGVGIWLGASKAPMIQKQTIEGVAMLVTAQNATEDYTALKGQLVTVVDDDGRTATYVMVMDVRVLSIGALINPSPPGNNYLITAVWNLKAMI